MKKFSLVAFILILTSQLFANVNLDNNLKNGVENKNTIENISKNIYSEKDILVGYYGRPYSKALGVLGVYDIDTLVDKMLKKRDEFQKITSEKIVPTFHIIKDIATKEPGWDNDHIKPLKEDIIMNYINRAQKENFAVILDVQLGTMKPIDAIKPILKYLKYPNVHLAVDPEFKIPTHGRYPPGKYIGHIFGEDVNEVQEAMQNYMDEHKIVGKRMLIVHMFYERMLRKKEVVKNYDSINLVYNIDGHGRGQTKIKIYNALYNEDAQKVAKGGFKIFFKNDKKPLMTPKQILGMESVKSSQIRTKPYYINYH